MNHNQIWSYARSTRLKTNNCFVIQISRRNKLQPIIGKTNDNTKVMSLFYQWRLRSKTETIIGKQFIRKANSCKIDCFNGTLIPNMRNHVCQKFQDCTNLSYTVSIKIKWCLLWKIHDAQLLFTKLNPRVTEKNWFESKKSPKLISKF
jgi:hypothetical protein